MTALIILGIIAIIITIIMLIPIGADIAYEGGELRISAKLAGFLLQLIPRPPRDDSKPKKEEKPPVLSQSALETLAVVAYFQPVTRAYIDQVRGVDSSYTVLSLTEKGLIESCGKLDVPGRPAVFRTTDAFLRTMGISALEELPELPDMSTGEGMEKLKNEIERLQRGDYQQITISDLTENKGEE